MVKSAIKKFFRSGYFVPFCFVLAVILRILWLLLVDSKPVSDSFWYYEKGIEIASGKGYVIQDLPTAYYPVGYPIFLALVFKIFGNYLLAGKIFNIILYVGILYFSYYISKNIFNSEFVGKITLFILSIYPNHIAYTSILSTEILFLFLFLSGAYLILRFGKNVWSLILSGFIWGFMCLVRPQGILIPVLLILTLPLPVWKTFWEKLKGALLVYVFIFIVMLPWVIRNYYVFNEFFIVSTNDGINLLIGNNPNASGEYSLSNETIYYLWDSENQYSSPDSLVKNLPNSKYWTRYGFKDENVASKKFRQKAFEFVVNNPKAEIVLLPKKLLLNYKKGNEGIGWALTEIPINSDFRKKSFSIFNKAANYFYYAVMIFSLFYLIKSGYKIWSKKQKPPFPLTGLYTILYFTMLAVIFFGGYRFNFPVIPWLVMYFSASLESIASPKKIIENYTAK
jgi:4-amino-4-deoxy-L-arabinose transferase-like glycosyltransferase